ncbi:MULTISPECIES: ABC transporter permease [Chromohalobacter]|uniref:ABC transporter permease n=2 Tax=Chromohalobacter TaxID=42054 RepID=A0A9X2X1P6_9GAMM|nr:MULTISPECIES: ABC transporter permease [Chromohalobacter]MCK0770188.1 ABC transporter permease [Chromohalobacter canadensis]MCK2046299.1 ABC transporter permease [Chromohalobacter moromii]MCT8505277.1 ABC transporter permease [Chromohalobacter moromii]WQH10290.1 ABC transporter permease [Chromohalobacter canadensis]
MLRKLMGFMVSNPLSGVISVLVIILVSASILSENFLNSYNLVIVSRTLAFIGLITIGQSMLMILGELDLSLGAIGGFCGVIGGIMMVNMGINPWLSFGLCLVIGTLFGVINGLLVTLLRLPSLVLTIGMAGVYGGLNLVITKGVAITGIPADIGFMGSGTWLGMPVPFWVMLVFLALACFLTLKTPFGRYMYAVGSNLPAAQMLGIRTDRVRVGVFAFAGFLAALAGMLMVARLGSAQPSIGDSWVLGPIAAAVIGGVPTTGGIGTPLGAIFGAAIIGVIKNIIVLIGVSPYWQAMVTGAIVVVAIALDSISRRYFKRD